MASAVVWIICSIFCQQWTDKLFCQALSLTILKRHSPGSPSLSLWHIQSPRTIKSNVKKNTTVAIDLCVKFSKHLLGDCVSKWDKGHHWLTWRGVDKETLTKPWFMSPPLTPYEFYLILRVVFKTTETWEQFERLEYHAIKNHVPTVPTCMSLKLQWAV